MARPGTDGRISFADLPAGDYLLAALTDVEPNEWQKPDVLAELAPAGVRSPSERASENIRICR
jgi:hypothetical protein